MTKLGIVLHLIRFQNKLIDYSSKSLFAVIMAIDKDANDRIFGTVSVSEEPPR